MNNESTTGQQALDIADKYGEKIASALSSMADSLGVAVSELWTILVRQQVVEAITCSITSVVLLVFVFFSIKGIKNYREWWRSSNKDYKDEGFQVFVFFVSLATILISVVSLFCLFDPIVTGFVNPEYGAVKEVFQVIKSL